jgi:hypothetical protein
MAWFHHARGDAMTPLDELRCPHCGEVNKAGVSHLIVREPNGLLLCLVCTFGWREAPTPPEKTS